MVICFSGADCFGLIERTFVALGPPCFNALARSFFHISRSPVRVSSSFLLVSKLSNVSLRICCTLMSLPSRNNSFTVLTNLESIFLVKLFPGLSANIRNSMMALY